jgi:hypothetical protein
MDATPDTTTPDTTTIPTEIKVGDVVGRFDEGGRWIVRPSAPRAPTPR